MDKARFKLDDNWRQAISLNQVEQKVNTVSSYHVTCAF